MHAVQTRRQLSTIYLARPRSVSPPPMYCTRPFRTHRILPPFPPPIHPSIHPGSAPVSQRATAICPRFLRLSTSTCHNTEADDHRPAMFAPLNPRPPVQATSHPHPHVSHPPNQPSHRLHHSLPRNHFLFAPCSHGPYRTRARSPSGKPNQPETSHSGKLSPNQPASQPPAHAPRAKAEVPLLLFFPVPLV